MHQTFKCFSRLQIDFLGMFVLNYSVKDWRWIIRKHCLPNVSCLILIRNLYRCYNRTAHCRWCNRFIRYLLPTDTYTRWLRIALVTRNVQFIQSYIDLIGNSNDQITIAKSELRFSGWFCQIDQNEMHVGPASHEVEPTRLQRLAQGLGVAQHLAGVGNERFRLHLYVRKVNTYTDLGTRLM